MVFILTLVAALVTLVLNLSGVIAISWWWIVAIWPGIWLAFWLAVLVLVFFGFGIVAVVSKRQQNAFRSRLR